MENGNININIDDLVAAQAEHSQNVLRYINRNKPGSMPESASKDGGNDWLPIYGIIGVVLAAIAVLLMMVAPIAVVLIDLFH